jgi:hypothetical protein
MREDLVTLEETAERRWVYLPENLIGTDFRVLTIH